MRETTASNEEILIDVASAVRDACLNTKWSFDVSNDNVRKPNASEIKNWLIRELQSHYHSCKGTNLEYSRQTFYTLKGEARRNSLIPVLNFISKRGDPGIFDRFDDYRESECMMDVIAKISYNDQITVATIEIDCNEKEV